MVQIYREKWTRGFLKSLGGYIRDLIILALPIKRLPPWLLKLLYGVRDARFAFLVHARNYHDIFISAPFLKPLKFFLRRKLAYRFFSYFPPFVLNRVFTNHGINGLVIAQCTVPEIILSRRKQTIQNLEQMLILASKILGPQSIIGLGGWFPMVTRRGLALETKARELNLVLTNGHCGTLASIYMTVEKISNIVDMGMNQMILTIIGVGRMGLNIGRAFHGKVARLILIDINEKNLKQAEEILTRSSSGTKLDAILVNSENKNAIRDVLRESHIGICATSNLRNLLKVKDMPDGFIAIDDSRPEALPRDPKLQRIVLEGGLLKIKGARLDYNYGFGEDDNVFGCLGEAFLLALDGGHHLRPTLGAVDMDNFNNLLKFCKQKGVSEGDFKSSRSLVSPELIASAFKRRKILQGNRFGLRS